MFQNEGFIANIFLSSAKIYFCIDIDKFQFVLNVLAHFLLFSDYSHVHSDRCAVSSCSEGLTASWTPLLYSQPCVEVNRKVRVWHKESVRAWYFFFFIIICVCACENSLCVSETAKSLRFFYENASTNTTDYGYEWDQEKPLSISLFLCYCSFYKSLLSRALSVATWGREGLLNPHQDERKCFKCLAWWVFVVVILVQFDFFENNWIFIDFSGDQSWTYITEKNSSRESRKKKYMTLYIDLAIILYWTNGI